MKQNDFQTLDLRQDQLETLLRISRLFHGVELQEHLIAQALDWVIEVLGAERGLFARCVDDDFTIVTARNMDKKSIDDLSQFSLGILRQVASGGKPKLYHDVQADATVSQFQSIQIHRIQSIVGVPLFHHGKVWGVILADSRSNRTRFTEENLKFLELFSHLISPHLDRIIELEALRDENRLLRQRIEAQEELPEMIGESPAMRRVAELIRRVAKTDATVLLLGESGTGKELAARAIHQLSNRCKGTFIAQFCGSIPEALLEGELFGFKKGAFTGAVSDKKGLFEVASGGTFFLDEIGDLPLSTQTKLLRVLENQEIIRLGETQVRKIDVRIIAATNRDLKELVKNGRFREDLYYRLNVFPIVLPPLRERREDIPLLVHRHLTKLGCTATPTPESMRKLMNYSWPGNIRQLVNVLHRAVILCDGEKIGPEHILLDEASEDVALTGTLKEIETKILMQRLKACNNNRTQAAKSLGVSVRWIQLKLKEMEQAEQAHDE
ncbi:MAG: sigma-54-dependent Fis family transcriptional regulator [candidate division KSB1 bacterium]|nr:sigma-54-dependent Fis family transcriptional regulator [candidate division KSB1 bacterium]